MVAPPRERLRKAEDAGENLTAKSIQLLIAREACIKQWRCIRACLKPQNSIALNELDISQNGGFKTLTDRDEIEAAIMENNSRRFRLASLYHLNFGGIAEALGRFSTSWLGTAILRGAELFPRSLPPQLCGLLITIQHFATAVGGCAILKTYRARTFNRTGGKRRRGRLLHFQASISDITKRQQEATYCQKFTR